MYSIDILGLLKTAFNVDIQVYNANEAGLQGSNTIGFKVGPGSTEKKAKAISLLNTSILMPIQFEAVKLEKLVDGKKVVYNTPKMKLPAACIIDISRAKKIVKTDIAGRDGTVKEFIGHDDWSVRIRGVIVNENSPNDYPEEQVRRIADFAQLPTAIGIVNDLCNWLGINDIVIEHFDLPAMEGYSGTQPFVLDCISEIPFEIKKKNNL